MARVKKTVGRPTKGSQNRERRNITLSDEAWRGLEEVAKILGCSRSDLIEWWATVASNPANQEVFETISDNERMAGKQQVFDAMWTRLPDHMRQTLVAKYGAIQAQEIKILPPVVSLD